MQGGFHIFALTSEFPFSEEVAKSATRELAKIPPVRVSTTKISIVSCISHEMMHFVHFTSHPACIFINLMEHHVYAQKMLITTQHGRTFYADRPKTEYGPGEIKHPEIYADYMLLDRLNLTRDLLLNFGNYPVLRLRQLNEMMQRDEDNVDIGDDSFVPHITLPSNSEMALTRQGPTLEQIVESLACFEELRFLERCVDTHGSRARRVLDELSGQYAVNQRYSHALTFFDDKLNVPNASALPVLLLILSLCGPCVGEHEVAWSEFHPTNRLHALMGAAEQLSAPERNVSFGAPGLVEWSADIDRRLAVVLGWTPALENVMKALAHVDHLASRNDINLVPILRMQRYLREKSENLLFPHRLLNPAIVLQPPLSIFADGVHFTSASRQESEQLLTYGRIIALQFCCRYLISNNATSAADTQVARRVHRLMRARLERSRVFNIDNEFPRDYDEFVEHLVFGSQKHGLWGRTFDD